MTNATETTTARAREAMGLAGTQPGAALSTLDTRIAKLRTMEARFADAVSGGLAPATLVGDAITALRTVKDLAACSEGSFFGSLMTAAQLGLRPNVGQLGHCWVLPYWSSKDNCHQAQLILGYQGMVELGYRTGIVEKITAHTIYENEPHKILRGTADVLEHEPMRKRDERGERAWHYAVVWLKTGGIIWHAITEEDARDVMGKHAPRNRQRQIVGPWVSDYDTMARKTALRGLWRFMPKTSILALALALDGTVRDGVDAVPSEAITVERAEPGATVDEPGAPPVEAEPVDEPQQADEPAQARSPLPGTARRGALIKAIDDKHGPDAFTAAEIVTGEQIGVLDALTDDELRAALALDVAAIADYIAEQSKPAE